MLAITALHLTHDGLLDLAMPIARWLGSGPAWFQSVTLHQLLTHTAGLGHWKDMPQWDMSDPPERDELVATVLATPRPHPEGTFSYSNFGYALAADVLERATGTHYADLAQEAVFEPAEMTSTTSGVFPIDRPDCAIGQNNGTWVDVSATPTGVAGMGDLWTTTEDLIRLSLSIRHRRLLNPELTHALLNQQEPLPAPTVLADERITAHGYGYGTWIGSYQSKAAVILAGDNDGYRSLLLQIEEMDLDLAVLTNDDGPTLRRPLDLALTNST